MIKPKWFLISIVITLLSCNKQSQTTDTVASVNQQHLSKTELMQAMPKNLSAKDSTDWADTYIKNWATNQLLYQKAKQHINQNKKEEIKKKVKQYQQDLFINDYTNSLLQEANKDSILPQEIKQHYQQHISSFVLNRQLFKIQLFSFPKSQENKALQLLGSNNNIPQLKTMATKHNTPFYVTDSAQWDNKAQIISKAKTHFFNELNTTQLRTNQFFKKHDKQFVHFLKLDQVLQKGDTAPIDYVKSSIKNTIISKRKLTLLAKLKDEIYNHAKSEQIIQQNTNN